MKKLLIIIIITFIGFNLYAGKQLDLILSKLIENDEKFREQIKDYTYDADSVALELDDDGTVEKKTEAFRKVYIKMPDKMHEDYISMKINGKDLNREEIEEELEERRKRGKKRAFISPFNKALRDKYRFTLMGEKNWDKRDVWIVGIQAKEEKEDLINGKVYVLKSNYRVVFMDFVPAELPGVIKKAGMRMIFSEQQGHWLPKKFEMEMHIKVKFLISLADIRLKVIDKYSNYKVNTGLKDSFFKEKEE
ncbi:MAG: outer membrane lipoprotein-sorting protein [Spirochaetes bacterium]|nr:outer membrane lipoprotein-sorting protein [Spirochaetota bacterium]